MNTFGRFFRVHVFGESHGSFIGVNIDGCPPGIPLSEEDFNPDLNRRRSGAPGTTPRKEKDEPRIVSGLYQGNTTGAPLTILFANENIKPGDYKNLSATPRPGHSDFPAVKKFKGYNDPRGGGHFSGRLTLALVAAGIVAKKILGNIHIAAQLIQAGGSTKISEAVEEVLTQGDSIGGLVECKAQNIPVGWGEPFFDSLESCIAHLAFSVPAIKGIEFGSGFAAASMRGSKHNDPILTPQGKTSTNNAGGIAGGLSNGNEMIFRVAVKPTSSISKPQQTIDLSTGEMATLEVKGRHDACIALRVPVVIEAITAICLADFMLISKTKNQ